MVDTGVIDDSGAIFLGTESGKLTKNGLGTLTLSAANTYHGTTTVTGGTGGVVQLTNPQGLGLNSDAQDTRERHRRGRHRLVLAPLYG